MRKRFSPRVAFFTAWIALSLMSIAWAFASPLGSGPDEPAHLIKAASVVRGELVGPQGDTGNIVDVPAAVAWTATQDCYRFDLNQMLDARRPSRVPVPRPSRPRRRPATTTPSTTLSSAGRPCS